MAIKYYTGFESDLAILNADGIVTAGSASVSIAQRHRTISGRGGSQSVLCGNGGTVTMPAFSVSTGEQIGLAIYHVNSGQTWTVQFFHSSNPVTENCSVRLGNDGFLRINRNSTVLATSAGIVPSATWNWLKIVVTATDTGRIQVFLNGSLTAFVDTGASVDCQNGASPHFESVRITGSSGGVHVDDYVQASSGSLPDRELFVQQIRPVAESGTPDGVPSTGTDNAAMVNQSTSLITRFNEITISGGEDRFTFGDIAFTPLEVLAVRTMSDMTAEGSLTDGRGMIEIGGLTTYGTNKAIATGGTYAIIGDIFELAPDGSPLTGAKVDSIIAGYEVN